MNASPNMANGFRFRQSSELPLYERTPMSRYVIVFKGQSDPSRSETRSLASELANSVQVMDQMLGVYLVDNPAFGRIAGMIVGRADNVAGLTAHIQWNTQDEAAMNPHPKSVGLC